MKARSASVSGLAAMAVALVFVGGPPRVAAAPASHRTVTVRMTDAHVFEPRVVVVHPGDDVVWTNEDRAVHSVVGDPWLALHRIDIEPPAPPEPFHSEDLGPGQSFRRTFELEGVYRYVCPHHEEEGMNGTVLVERLHQR